MDNILRIGNSTQGKRDATTLDRDAIGNCIKRMARGFGGAGREHMVKCLCCYTTHEFNIVDSFAIL